MRAGFIQTSKRRFLLLQGPHGPFFSSLGARLRDAGADVFRVGFNRGDQLFWSGPGFIPFRSDHAAWPDALDQLIAEHGITDLVCYGSSRPIHQVALARGKAAGLTNHVFEEGYLRPYWVTYERGGANAASPVTKLSLGDMAEALNSGSPALFEAPDRWGDMRAHMFWGAAYHAALLIGNKGFPSFKPHRQPGVGGEFGLYLRKFANTPFRAIGRKIATMRVRYGGFPYHLVLLQLAHDANFLDHGPFPDQASFLNTLFRGFAAGAPKHHHLVLKAHPLEDGREPLKPIIASLISEYDLQGRVHFIAGGKLARLLDAAKSALTVNSTAAEQALWRSLPLKAFGAAVYDRPEFVSNQTLADFFASPARPDREAYLTYRAFLLATSQVPGGFYGFFSRRKLLRQIPDLMLAKEDSYTKILEKSDATSQQHLHSVR